MTNKVPGLELKAFWSGWTQKASMAWWEVNVSENHQWCGVVSGSNPALPEGEVKTWCYGNKNCVWHFTDDQEQHDASHHVACSLQITAYVQAQFHK